MVMNTPNGIIFLSFRLMKNNAEKSARQDCWQNILYAMTFFGFDEENIDKEQP